MYNFPIGVLLESFKLPVIESLDKAKALGMDQIDWEGVIAKVVPEKFLELNLAAYRAGRAAVK